LPDRVDLIDRLSSELGLPVIVRLEGLNGHSAERASDMGAAAVIGPDCDAALLRGCVSTVMQWCERLNTLQCEVDALRTRLEDRKVIERAKWRIVESAGVTEPEALRLMQRWARRQREKLVHVANRTLAHPDSIIQMQEHAAD
jgi:response regulator NasT